jgi:hypothetical protein
MSGPLGDFGDECLPGRWWEDQRRPGRVFRIAYADDAGKVVGHLDAGPAGGGGPRRLTSAPTDAARRATLIPEITRITRRAIRDLRGRAGGPTPPEIVRRFLWFLPLTDEEARAIALRLR